MLILLFPYCAIVYSAFNHLIVSHLQHESIKWLEVKDSLYETLRPTTNSKVYNVVCVRNTVAIAKSYILHTIVSDVPRL